MKAIATTVVIMIIAMKRFCDASPVSNSMLERLFIIVCLIWVELEIESLPPPASLVPTKTPEPAIKPPAIRNAMLVKIIVIMGGLTWLVRLWLSGVCGLAGPNRLGGK